MYYDAARMAERPHRNNVGRLCRRWCGGCDGQLCFFRGVRGQQCLLHILLTLTQRCQRWESFLWDVSLGRVICEALIPRCIAPWTITWKQQVEFAHITLSADMRQEKIFYKE